MTFEILAPRGARATVDAAAIAALVVALEAATSAADDRDAHLAAAARAALPATSRWRRAGREYGA